MDTIFSLELLLFGHGINLLMQCEQKNFSQNYFIYVFSGILNSEFCL